MIPYICTKFGSFRTITEADKFGQKTYACIHREKVLDGKGSSGGLTSTLGRRHMLELARMNPNCSIWVGRALVFGLTERNLGCGLMPFVRLHLACAVWNGSFSILCFGGLDLMRWLQICDSHWEGNRLGNTPLDVPFGRLGQFCLLVGSAKR